MKRLSFVFVISSLMIIALLIAISPVEADGEENCTWFTYEHHFYSGLGLWTDLNNAEYYDNRLRMKPSAVGDDHGYAILYDDDLLAAEGISTTWNLYIRDIGADPDGVSDLPSSANHAGIWQDANSSIFTVYDWKKTWDKNDSYPDDYHLYTANDRSDWNESDMEVNKIHLAVTHGGQHNNTWMYWDYVYIKGCACESGYYPTDYEYEPWSENAKIFYPVEQDNDLGYYKVYSETSAYGLPYKYYNVWKTTTGAYAYSIASMEIVEIGSNFLGYYVRAQIDAWPDVQSTTVVYEGLNSVSVVEGEQVGASCVIGTVANRWELGEDDYHLALAVFYPDDSTPMDPRGYMIRYPDESTCQVFGKPGQSIGDPGYSSDPAGLWEPVCTDCVPPSLLEILSFGKWIDWLGCVITNLIFCTLVRLINSVIGFLYGIFMTGVNAVGWISGSINITANWIGTFWNNIIVIGINNVIRSSLNALIVSGPVKLIWSMVRRIDLIWENREVFLKLAFGFLKNAAARFASLAKYVKDFVEAIAAVFNVEAVDIFDLYGFTESGGGEATGLTPGAGGSFYDFLQVEGPNTGKALWLVFMGMYYIDWQIEDQNAVFTIMIWLIYGITAWSVIWWVISQFEDAAEEATG